MAKRFMNIGDVVYSSDTRFGIYANQNDFANQTQTYSNLGTAKWTLTGPYIETIPGAGGNLPPNLNTIHLEYEWSLDGSYNHKSGSVKETYTLCQPYGLVHWQTQNWNVGNGSYDPPNDATNYNILTSGAGPAFADPNPFGVDDGGGLPTVSAWNGTFTITGIESAGVGRVAAIITWDQSGPDTTGPNGTLTNVISTFASAKDENFLPITVAGGVDGNLYLLYQQNAPDVGSTSITGEALMLAYLGPERNAVKCLEWYGDPAAQWFVNRKMNISVGNSIPFDASQMQCLTDDPTDPEMQLQGDENNSHYVVNVPVPEMIHILILLRLSGISPPVLTFPPHVPLEYSGRVWLVAPQLGTARPR